MSSATLAAAMLFGGLPIALIGMAAGWLVKAILFGDPLRSVRGVPVAKRNRAGKVVVLGPEPRIEWREPAPF